jgi:hypothetical protein
MAAAPAPLTPELSEPSRLINTFFAPSRTFSDLRRNASWWAPWLLISLASVGFVATLDRSIGFEQLSRTMIEKSSRAQQLEQLPPDQKEKQLRATATMTKAFSYGTPVTLLIAFVVIAAVLMATFNFGTGAEIGFKNSLAIVTYASLPGVISAILGIASLLAGLNPEGFDIRNPVASNPAYFMDPGGNKFLYTMATALDVFVLWSIALMAIGYSANSKLKRSTAFAIVLGWYLLYKLIGAGFAVMFS